MATNFATWVTEQESRREPEDTFEIKSVEPIQDFEQELKLLKWHKLANEAALKAAIIKTKRLKRKETVEIGGSRQDEKSAWMHQVIQEEQVKPLEVSEEFIKDFKKKESRDDHRVEDEMKRHIKNLNRVKDDIAQKEEQRFRNERYREKKRELANQAKAVQEASLRSGKIPSINMLTKTDIQTQNSQSTTKKVVSHLDKLVELERRISLLERTDGGTTRKKLSFEKHRTAGNNIAPAKNKFHVRVKSKNPSSLNTNQEEDDDGGTFLTTLPKIRTPSTALTTTKRSANSRVRDRLTGAKKQDQQVESWLNKRSSRPISKISTPAEKRREALRVSAAARSAKKGNTTLALSKKTTVSTKDRMKEFRDVRKQFDRRKQNLARNIHGKYDGSIRKDKAAPIRNIKQIRKPTSLTAVPKASRGIVVRNQSVKVAKRQEVSSRVNARKQLVGKNGNSLRRSVPKTNAMKTPVFGVIGNSNQLPRLR